MNDPYNIGCYTTIDQWESLFKLGATRDTESEVCWQMI